MSKVRVFIIAKGIYILRTHINYHKRPYHIESTPSRPIWEVKQCRARLVRWWETTLEVLVSLLTFFTKDRMYRENPPPFDYSTKTKVGEMFIFILFFFSKTKVGEMFSFLFA
jgi:hypothetical protein